MRQRIPWTKYLIPWLALGLFTSYIFYLPRNYIWVVVILGVAFVDRGGLVCLNSAARFDKWNRARRLSSGGARILRRTHWCYGDECSGRHLCAEILANAA